MDKIKAMQVIEYGDNSEKGRIYLVEDNDFVKANVNDEFEVDEDMNGQYEGFRVFNGCDFEYILKDFVKVYKEVNFSIKKSIVDGYAEGYNKVIASINGKDEELSACRLEDDYNNCCLVLV